MIDFDVPADWLESDVEVSVQPGIPTQHGLSFSTTKGKLKSVLPGALLLSVTNMQDGSMFDVLLPKAVVQHIKVTSAISAVPGNVRGLRSVILP